MTTEPTRKIADDLTRAAQALGEALIVIRINAGELRKLDRHATIVRELGVLAEVIDPSGRRGLAQQVRDLRDRLYATTSEGGPK